MGIKRNEGTEPEWRMSNYAMIIKEDLFCDEVWKRSIHWNTLLTQVRKAEHACLLIDPYSYPSRMFSAYIDILEATLLVLDDIFYYETRIRFGVSNNYTATSRVIFDLRLWIFDYYKEVEEFCETLERIRSHLMECLSHQFVLEVADRVKKHSMYAYYYKKPQKPCSSEHFEKPIFAYAYGAYRGSGKDIDTLSQQIVNILRIVENYLSIGQCLKPMALHALNFEDLTTDFRHSEKGQNFIKPWRIEYGGTRDSLISRMERDPELGPWVNRYIHCKADKNIIEHLFLDERDMIKNKEEVFNTDNWIRLLTIAAVLQEYDEHQKAPDSSEEKEEEKGEDILLLKLSLYFKDEDTVRRFLKSVRQMNNTEITTLVSNYHKAGLCTDVSKNLWKVLHDAGLYKPGYTNWNAQVK